MAFVQIRSAVTYVRFANANLSTTKPTEDHSRPGKTLRRSIITLSLYNCCSSWEAPGVSHNPSSQERCLWEKVWAREKSKLFCGHTPQVIMLVHRAIPPYCTHGDYDDMLDKMFKLLLISCRRRRASGNVTVLRQTPDTHLTRGVEIASRTHPEASTPPLLQSRSQRQCQQ